MLEFAMSAVGTNLLEARRRRMTKLQHNEETRQSAQRRKPRAPNAPPLPNRAHGLSPRAKNSDIVYQDLKNEIVSMRLVPGTPILEKELTERYGISRTPVREAVLRLADEQLLDVAPKSGTFVSRISVAKLREALVARRALEAVIVRAATEIASESDILNMRALILRQREVAEAGDEEAFHRADNDFHSAIASSGKLAGIWDLIQQVRIQIERYRRLTLPQPGRMLKVVDEHSAVLDAIERRDALAAVERMEVHLDKLQLDIAVFRDQWPDFFVFDPVDDGKLLALDELAPPETRGE